MLHRLIVPIAVLAATACFAASSSTRYTGELINGVTPQSVAMGETGIIGATGPIEGIRNPAQLSRLDRGIHVEAVGIAPQNVEARSFPVYDGFDGVLRYNQYVSNSMGESQFAIGASMSVKSLGGTPWTIAFVSKPSIDYTYKYFEEIRDRYATGGLQDRVLGRVEDKTSGIRRWTGFAVSAAVCKDMNVGVSFGMITGNITSSYRLARNLPTDSSSLITLYNKPDNAHMELRAGSTFAVSDRLMTALSVTYRGDRNDKLTLDSTAGGINSSYTVVLNRRYPVSVGLGMEYIPGQQLRSKFVAELEWTNWITADMDTIERDLQNTVELRAGIEHRVLPEVPVRFGYRYAPNPYDRNNPLSFLSVGTGYEKGPWTLDIGMQFGHVTSTGADPVPDQWFGGSPRNDVDHVQDKMFRASFGIAYRFVAPEK